MDKTVAFIGLGYIGLPTAVVMAESGLKVVGVDISQERVDKINRAETPIVEPGLEEALRKVVTADKLTASTEPPEADCYILAVPTPFEENHQIDISFIYAAADSIAPKLNPGALVILESTSPPGTTEKLAQRIISQRPDLTVDGQPNATAESCVYFAHCPERILPGNALEELKTNDRIIGGMSPRATELATAIYRSFCKGELLPTNAKTAEMAKLTENSFRDVNIAFANELSVICDRLGINVWELIELANHHPRVNILQPGPGVGGHCIAVDPWFIVSTDPQNARLIHTARNINDEKPNWVLSKLSESVENKPDEKIALLGLAFKANIDDLRESPALNIAESVAAQFDAASISVVEPNIEVLPNSLAARPNVRLEALESALSGATFVLLLVDHNEFRKIDKSKLESAKVLDTKGLWENLRDQRRGMVNDYR